MVACDARETESMRRLKRSGRRDKNRAKDGTRTEQMMRRKQSRRQDASRAEEVAAIAQAKPKPDAIA